MKVICGIFIFLVVCLLGVSDGSSVTTSIENEQTIRYTHVTWIPSMNLQPPESQCAQLTRDEPFEFNITVKVTALLSQNLWNEGDVVIENPDPTNFANIDKVEVGIGSSLLSVTCKDLVVFPHSTVTCNYSGYSVYKKEFWVNVKTISSSDVQGSNTTFPVDVFYWSKGYMCAWVFDWFLYLRDHYYEEICVDGEKSLGDFTVVFQYSEQTKCGPDNYYTKHIGVNPPTWRTKQLTACADVSCEGIEGECIWSAEVFANNPSIWPNGYKPEDLFNGGPKTLGDLVSNTDAMSCFDVLGKQYVTVQLNLALGAAIPTSTQNALEEADELMVELKSDDTTVCNDHNVLSVALDLEFFNEGLLVNPNIDCPDVPSH